MKELLNALGQKAALLERLLEETARQGALISSKDLEGLRRSIGARQAIMDEIDALDSRIRQGGGLSAAPGDGEAERLYGQIRELLARIGEVDAENRKKADDLAATFRSGIRETNAERNLLAYLQAAPGGSRFVNRKG